MAWWDLAIYKKSNPSVPFLKIPVDPFPERWQMLHLWRHSRSGWTGLWAPDLAADIPIHCRGVGLDDLYKSFPTKEFYYSILSPQILPFFFSPSLSHSTRREWVISYVVLGCLPNSVLVSRLETACMKQEGFISIFSICIKTRKTIVILRMSWK